MDNIVDYLVVGFFIISFLSSIFKKKKKQVKKAENEQMDLATQTKEIIRKKKSNNPFESFINSINEELTMAKEEVSRSEVDEYYEEALMNSTAETEVKQNIYQQRKYITHEPAKEVAKRNEVNATISYSDSLKNSREKRESKKAKDIRESLLQGSSIKNFIIVNEILGKPKALQR